MKGGVVRQSDPLPEPATARTRAWRPPCSSPPLRSTLIVPSFAQVDPSKEAVNVQEKDPVCLYVWRGSERFEELPSPKSQSSVGVPLQPSEGVTSDENRTRWPTLAESGASAVHSREQVPPLSMTMVPVLEHEAPLRVAVTVQV